MKVLIIIPYISLIYGGTSRTAQEIAESLGKLNISVDIITTNANGDDYLDVPLQTWIQKPFYRIQYFPCWHRYDFIFSTSLLSWFARHCNDYSIVHTHTLFSPLISIIHAICKYQEIPYITTPHGMLESWALSNKNFKKNLYFKYIEKPLLKHAAKIQALNQCENRSIHNLGLKHTNIISNGICTEKFQSLSNSENFYNHFPGTREKQIILFLSRLDPKKGLDLLAPAFAKVHTRFPQTHLVVAGPDNINFLPKAQRYFTEANCLEAVTFTGMLSGELKYAALSAANLYVLPSYSEGFSMSILEAMASKLPCIITQTCNFPEAAKANVACVVETNIDAITKALLWCITNPQEARSMGERARNFIFENYTWEKTACKLVHAYTEAIMTASKGSASTVTSIQEQNHQVRSR